MDDTSQRIPKVAVNGLAVVGFVALIIVGISLAIYSTRFVPAVVNRIGSAAVYLGSIFVPRQDPSLSVVPTPTSSTTIFFGGVSSSTSTITATSTSLSTTAAPKPATGISSDQNTSNTYRVGSTTGAIVPHGLSDFTVKITTIGYLTTNSTDSFVGAGTVPSGNLPAVKFTIKNVGTNWSGRWRFNASIPTRTSYTFESDLQQSLAPGDSIDYILGFDQASVGSSQPVAISVNFDRAAVESDYGNNSASAPLDIQ